MQIDYAIFYIEIYYSNIGILFTLVAKAIL